MASASSSSNFAANAMPQHQVWGRIEAVASAAGSCSSSGSHHSAPPMQDTKWLSSSDGFSSGSQPGHASAHAAAQQEPEEDDPSLPSIGSRGHAIGKCKQCYHFSSPGGCKKGKACTYCHLHIKSKRGRMRPSITIRNFAKSQAAFLDGMTDKDEMKRAAEELLSNNQCRYLHLVVRKKLLARGVELFSALGDPELSSKDGESGNEQDFEHSGASKKPPQQASRSRR
eukprot:CAMPEP_0172838068 /NCGR_PEP_ID=MMETSP1075-20121228/27621_1 /TAXON_ID=2916 /ORGANISM="Ceratium fusus, Strain PA161109" /LENGTH=226 /DNA_ID=CAMNT_0013681531 /DNA_START=49 /DNA_END=726 /DNA_ORIENTATION=-